MHVGALHLYELPAGFKGRFVTAVRKHIGAAAGHAGAAPAAVVDAAEHGQPGLGRCRARPAPARGGLPSCPRAPACPSWRPRSPAARAAAGPQRPLWKFHVFEGLAPGPNGQRRVGRSTRSCTTPRSTARRRWRWPTRCSTSRPCRAPSSSAVAAAEGLQARDDRDAARRDRPARRRRWRTSSASLPSTVGTLKDAAGDVVRTRRCWTGKAKGPAT
jgi:diacylglycerol O-acyltransferase